MLKIEIKNALVSEKAYDFTNDRGERVTGVKRTQSGYVYIPGKAYPIEVEVKLAQDQAPWAPGSYVIHPDSFRVFRGQLQLGRLVLAAPASARAA